MATYELDDQDATYVVEVLAVRASQQASELADRIRAQIPIPVPVKIGAVVRTYGTFADDGPDAGAVFLRWATDNHTHSPWIEAGNHEQPYRTDEIGRITEVLSPGVDL